MANASMAFKARGDPTRREQTKRLAKRPLAVIDLAKTLPVSRPAVSQHLRVLQDADSRVAVSHRAGTEFVPDGLDVIPIAADERHLRQPSQTIVVPLNRQSIPRMWVKYVTLPFVSY